MEWIAEEWIGFSSAVGPTEKAPDYGSGGWGFESLTAHEIGLDWRGRDCNGREGAGERGIGWVYVPLAQSG